ncbi:hypothetical protein GTW43_24950 [Streptomyces sp. SID5785]|uniref:hypothetical protein n=1 Tax=Streptomyces sp. SID5785 TaxID=2690309 RepID=UPI0013617E55|nr:hypothetical protein [Streptomyces sp. SID5785]MZD08304.1 hypothetical protein [Streptomyces sp. SID5785]
MSTPPEIIIAREPTGNVIAEGGDELAHTLLKRAGFQYEQSIRSFWYRLPWDMGEERENQMASHAARMLTAVGYDVDLGKDLLVGPVTTPSDPQDQRTYGHQILSLIDQLNEAGTYSAAAEVTEHVLDPQDGVLIRLGEFFDHAAEQADAVPSTDAAHVAMRLESAAEKIRSLGDYLDGVGDDLRDLGPTPPSPAPSWHQKVAGYFATATRRRAQTTETPTDPPARTLPTEQRPDRTR